MANTNYNETDNTGVNDDTKQWGQAILRSKTSLIKPYSKVND
jgi:hypothetical protein